MWTIDKRRLSMLAYVLSFASGQDPIKQPNAYVRNPMSKSSLIAKRRHVRSRGGRPCTTIRGGRRLLARMASTCRLHGVRAISTPSAPEKDRRFRRIHRVIVPPAPHAGHDGVPLPWLGEMLLGAWLWAALLSQQEATTPQTARSSHSP